MKRRSRPLLYTAKAPRSKRPGGLACVRGLCSTQAPHKGPIDISDPGPASGTILTLSSVFRRSHRVTGYSRQPPKRPGVKRHPMDDSESTSVPSPSGCPDFLDHRCAFRIPKEYSSWFGRASGNRCFLFPLLLHKVFPLFARSIDKSSTGLCMKSVDNPVRCLATMRACTPLAHDRPGDGR